MTDNKQYLQLFFDEAAEYIQILDDNILALEEDPEDQEIIAAIFRAAHSLKGMAATMGFKTLTTLTHNLESILSRVRDKNLVIDPELINLLFSGLDYIKELVEEVREEGKEETDLSTFIESLSYYLNNYLNNNNDQLAQDLSGEDLKKIKDNTGLDDEIYRIKVELNMVSEYKNVRGYMVLKKVMELGYLIRSEPDKKALKELDKETGNTVLITLISNLTEDEIKTEIREITDVKEVIINKLNKGEILDKINNNKKRKMVYDRSNNNGLQSSTLRVDIKKIDQLINMVGELLINKTRLETLEIDLDKYNDILDQLDRVTMELHHIVMQIRMVPVGVMFNRFPRMIRDLSRAMNKEINFIIEGEETELDRSIIDKLSEPLVHLLRNAVDHGIESPLLREKNGKAREGVISLKAFQKGSEIIIEVEDDGAGIDLDEVVKKALAKQIITEEELASMDKRDRLNLIFHPGFSTIEADKISDLSGRGVGMDVVKNTIENLDGQIYISSQKGTNTKFTISLPLTLAITEALMVKINDELFALPLNSINEILIIKPEDIKRVKGQEVFTLREQTIPLLEGRECLHLNTEYGLYRKREEIPVVTISTGDKQVGLIVDELLHQQEIVIKSLSDYLGNIDNISGATIVGDGDVALILDVRDIA
jgi:two-component system, chemotaxis family, sensor kinase CheA